MIELKSKVRKVRKVEGQVENKVKEAKKAIRERFWLRQVVIAFTGLFVIVMLSVIALSVYTKHGRQYELPNIVGMTMEEAEEASDGLRLRFDVFDSLYIPGQRKGAILEQYPKPGSIIKKNRRVVITINSYEPKRVEMPYVAGFSLRHAKSRLVSAGFEIGKLTYISDIATNNVIEQYYEGKLVSRSNPPIAYMGSKIDLVVGFNGSDALPSVPTLLGTTYRDARDMLWEKGFNLGTIKMDGDVDYTNMMDATVVDQTVFPNAIVSYGTTVGITISIDDAEIAKAKKASKHRQESVEVLKAKLRKHQDTIEWIRKGRMVRYKNHNEVYEYTPMDTFAIYDRIMIINQKLGEMLGTSDAKNTDDTNETDAI
ncbi:MAG: PASTA domain-containing protein [Rikenellaceae bacterium]